MKLRHAAALAFVLLASSSTDLAAIDQATQKAEDAAARAVTSATRAEVSAVNHPERLLMLKKRPMMLMVRYVGQTMLQRASRRPVQLNR